MLSPQHVMCDNLVIDKIFIASSDTNEETNLTKQFIINDANQIEQRYSTKKLTPEQYANLCRILSSGIKNINYMLNDVKTQINININTSVNVKVNSINKIKNDLKEKKLIKELDDIISLMKTHENDLLEGDIPTITSIEGIMLLYKNKTAIKIIKGIILRALLQRYTNTADDNMITLIFEFVMLLIEFQHDWLIVLENKSTSESSDIIVTNRKLRAMRKNLNPVSDFVYPQASDLLSDIFNDNIKIAFTNYVTKGEQLLSSKNIDPIKYQMVEAYFRLKPLTSWDVPKIKLDDWQLKVIELIDNEESVVISAPTSSGKTVCAQYCATKLSNKVLFLAPCDVLATQIAGTFMDAGYNTGLMTNNEAYNIKSDNKVIVATPAKAEVILVTSNIKFNYIVFDEIQQINDEEGEAIERIIKTCECAFLILSATIYQPEKFIEYLTYITNKKINFVNYNKRFIVQQKHIWDGVTLQCLHPFGCVDIDYILKDKFQTGDLAMTARDLYYLGLEMNKIFPDINKIHPSQYFNPKIPLTMDLIEKYDFFLKDIIISQASINPNKINELISKFYIKNVEIPTNDALISSIVSMLNSIKNNNMLPALMFMLNDISVLNIFKDIVHYLEKKEAYYFPWYQSYLESLTKEVKQFQQNESSIRESIARGLAGKGNKNKLINDQYNQQKRIFIDEFLKKIQNKYAIELYKVDKNELLSDTEKKMIINFLNKDYHDKLTQYKTNQINAIDVKLPSINPYCPTSLYTFNTIPLPIETMRSVKQIICKGLHNSSLDKSAKDISYNNIFLRGLERGLILYSNSLPASYKEIIQTMISSCKTIICITDTSLAYGVNFPTRTVILLGNSECEDICTLKAHQISGRSGRRGFDKQGHIVYCRVNHNNIMRGTYPPLIGKKDTITSYILLPGKFLESEKYIANIVKIPLNYYNNFDITTWNKQELLDNFQILYEDEIYKQDNMMLMLIWLYRDKPDIATNILTLVNELLKYKNFVKKNNKKDDNEFNKYMLEIHIHNQLIELLIRIFDRTNADVNEDIIDDIFPIPRNTNNTNLIKLILQNNNTIIESFNELIEIANRIHNVILEVLELYNFFASIGNITITSILDHPLNTLINFNNKLRSLNSIK